MEGQKVCHSFLPPKRRECGGNSYPQSVYAVLHLPRYKMARGYREVNGMSFILQAFLQQFPSLRLLHFKESRQEGQCLVAVAT